jgi:hypothetical protein
LPESASANDGDAEPLPSEVLGGNSRTNLREARPAGPAGGVMCHTLRVESGDIAPHPEVMFRKAPGGRIAAIPDPMTAMRIPAFHRSGSPYRNFGRFGTLSGSNSARDRPGT